MGIAVVCRRVKARERPPARTVASKGGTAPEMPGETNRVNTRASSMESQLGNQLGLRQGNARVMRAETQQETEEVSPQVTPRERHEGK